MSASEAVDVPARRPSLGRGVLARGPSPRRPSDRPRTRGVAGAALLLAAQSGTAVAAETGAGEALARTDYLTLAQGAVPLRVGGAAAALGFSFEGALRATDGNPAKYVLTRKPGASDADVEVVYQLPAATTFDRFAVPLDRETPAPSTTFTKTVEVHGSADGPDVGWIRLASATLAAPRETGAVAELAVEARPAVRWVKLRLAGGVDVRSEASFFEFSEIVGNGTQEPPPRSDRFAGTWSGRGVRLDLTQEGPVVTGCYDRGGELTGTVTGTVLRATGVDRPSGVPSLFLLGVTDAGGILGVRSTNGGPFAMYVGEPAPAGAGGKCGARPAPQLGCGAVIHGITFDYDSAAIRPDSDPVLATLARGLVGDAHGTVVIEGHTSSEGSDAYNRALSERRAAAVVEDLVRRGLAAGRLEAAGLGESRPIAPNADESGRALNRRVEVHCR